MPSKTPLRMSPLTAMEMNNWATLPAHKQIAMLEWCLWKLATIIEHYQKKRDKYAYNGALMLYERVERDLATLEAKESTMQRVRARLEQNKKPKESA